MGSLSKLPNGNFYAQVSIGGKRLSKSFKFKNEAKTWILEQETLKKSKLSTESAAPLRLVLSRYFNDVLAEKPAHNARHEKAVIGLICRDRLGDAPIKTVTTADIDAWIDRALTGISKQTGRPLKSSTVNRRLALLSSFFSWAIKQKLLRENPVKACKRLKDPPARERVASDDEIEALKLCAGWDENTPPYSSQARAVAAFVFCCFTGLRSGEVVKMERSWIDGNLLHLPAEATKTARGRAVILNARAMAILELVLELEESPTVWGLSDGLRDASFRQVRDKAGLGEVRDAKGRLVKEGLNFHDSRATFCTWAASPAPDGAPRMDVMSLARQTGHQNLKMLMRYYRPNMATLASRLDQ